MPAKTAQRNTCRRRADSLLGERAGPRKTTVRHTDPTLSSLPLIGNNGVTTKLEKKEPSPHTVANIGCLLIRGGETEHGIQIYRLAIDRARSPTFTVRALAFLCRELHFHQSPHWEIVRRECEALLVKHDSSVAQAVLQTIDANVEQPLKPIGKAVRAPRWIYDKERNVLIVPPRRFI